jgi:glycine cleavage system aminomethyltransferase T
LAKQLQGLRFAEEITLPAALSHDDHEVGVVTSVVRSPALGWIGLGYLKPSVAAPGQVVQSRHADRVVTTTVAALPFNPT